MQLNKARMGELESRLGEPRFKPGEKVRRLDFGDDVGVVDVIYADYRSAIDTSAVPEDWYAIQETPLRTPKEGRFYSVILVDGAILAGEDDLDSVN